MSDDRDVRRREIEQQIDGAFSDVSAEAKAAELTRVLAGVLTTLTRDMDEETQRSVVMAYFLR